MKQESRVEDVPSEETESDENDHLSASSVDAPQKSSESKEIMNLPLDGLKKYDYEVFMKRVHGPEKYYHLDKDKSVRENLVGKVILEYPEFLVVTTDLTGKYFEKITTEVDYKKGQKPIRPGNMTNQNEEKNSKSNYHRSTILKILKMRRFF